MPPKVFISYSHQDGPCAHGIARYLQRHECDVWIDAQNLKLGDRWAENIETALAGADALIGIISSSSLRRDEVLKEINFGLKRMREEGTEKFRVLFVVIGQIHPSWFRNDESTKEIKNHLSKYQYVQLSAYGEITIDAMRMLLRAIHQNGIDEGSTVFLKESEEGGFINSNAQPEKAFDNYGNNIYYKVFAADLAPSAVYPFALDNQWLPEVFYDRNHPLYTAFEKEGFTSDKVKAYEEGFKERNFLLPMIHFKQEIIKLNTFLYEPYFRKLLLNEGEEKKALKKLLGNGSIVVLLNNDQMSPYVNKENDDEAIIKWNELSQDTDIYCIRENWASQADQHSREFLRFCFNLAMDYDNNILLARAMGLDDSKVNDFLLTLKNVSMQAFCQTHMNGTLAQDKVDDYSRTLFYRNYIVSNNEMGDDAVYRCMFDEAKPFHHELKRLIDICYNSLFVSSLQCGEQLPDDVRPENYYLHSLYLKQGEKEVSIEELEYAFSEFFDHCEILDEITALGDRLYLENWDLNKICSLRNKEAWYAYVELLEMIRLRSDFWKVDFNEIELLLQRFLNCFEEKEKDLQSNDVAFSFRVLVGSKVLDIVKTMKVAKVKEYGGSYADPGKIPLKVFFAIGDLTREDRKKQIFVPVTLFNGRIDTDNGDGFFSKLKEFLIRQCGFVSIDG